MRCKRTGKLACSGNSHQVPTRIRQQRVRGRVDRPRAIRRASIRAAGPTHRPYASRVVAASKLRRNRSPIWSAGSSTADRSSTQTRCHQAPLDPIRVGGLPTSAVIASRLHSCSRAFLFLPWFPCHSSRRVCSCSRLECTARTCHRYARR